MEQKCDEGRWALVHSTETSTKSSEYFYDSDDDDEALSLSDLPLIHHQSIEHTNVEETQEDFDFNFGFCSLSKGPQMCSADEVFHQGQILPFNHSTISKKKLFSGSNSISGSMDGYSSAGFTNSSRNSSISSQSSSSSSSSAAVATTNSPTSYKSPARNQFHSHPRLSPRANTPANRRGMNRKDRVKKPLPWNIFRLGVVAAPQEIVFQDLKTRGNRGNRNRSNSSNSSSSSVCDKKVGMKRRPGLFRGCSCSNDAVHSKVTIMRRSAGAGEGESEARVVEEDLVATKKRLSSHRQTFEWLKQLSIEG